MIAQGKVTTDHKLIQKWAEARHGYPALIRKLTDAGIDLVLSFVFPDLPGDSIARKLTWDEFFEQFDRRRLVFVYEDKDRQQRPSRYFTFY